MKLVLSIWLKLRLVLAFSSALLSLWLGSAMAHEVQPTIADLSSDRQTVTLEFDVNLAALLSGINLDFTLNTDDAEDAEVYNALRALPPVAIASRAGELLPKWNAVPVLSSGGDALPLSLVSAITDDVANLELPRLTRLVLSATVPDGARSVVVTWPAGSGALVLRQQGVSEPYTGFLNGGSASPEITLSGGDAQSGWVAFLTYIPVGFDHILPKGLDHILFVLGLFFLSAKFAPLLWQISAFTLAHTVTLAMGALGWVNVPGSIVEPLIAASIVYVAVENIFAAQLTPWRPVIVFLFGLLHGLGFASVLGDFGLPEGHFIPALIGFNIGVELGQLTVIAMAFAAVGWCVSNDWYRRAVSIPASCLIAVIGGWWVIERTLL